MKKWFFALILAGTAWFGLKDIAYQAYMASGAVQTPPAPNYAEPEAWAAQPETLPPGAWATPWGIDAFLVLAPANTPRKHGLLAVDDADALNETLANLQKLNAAIPSQTPVYAPLYRAPSAASKGATLAQIRPLASADLMGAFEFYLAQANQGRGIMLIVSEGSAAYAEPLLERLQSEALSSRFAGLISIGPAVPRFKEQDLTCAAILKKACHQHVETQGVFSPLSFLLPRLARTAPELNVIDAPGVATAIRVQAETVSLWLDETQPKPAEPFFATQIIETAPIYRPGADEPLNKPNED